MDRPQKIAALLGGVAAPLVYLAAVWAVFYAHLSLKFFFVLILIFFPFGAMASVATTNIVGLVVLAIAAVFNAAWYVGALELYWAIFKREKPVSIAPQNYTGTGRRK